MTTTQIYVFSAIYLVVTIVVAVITRATARRILGAAVGATVGGVLALAVVALGERLGWWHMVISWTPYYLTLFVLGCTVGAFVFLITWRIERRFGWRGLALFLLSVAIIGPPRDMWYMRQFPEWGHYGPGLAPVFAIAGTYVLLVGLGHAVMRLVAGPSRADRLARRPWEAA
jgi:hypothetical protein